jgi:Phosphoribosylformylglycinamidine (FGAM) synthase, glutamine amidotransferase domain
MVSRLFVKWDFFLVFCSVMMLIVHGDGCYIVDDDIIVCFEGEGCVVFCYVNVKGEVTVVVNSNGVMHNIAGVINEIFSTLSITKITQNCKLSLRNRTPKKNPTSQTIWKPLQIPITNPPHLACTTTSYIINKKHTITPEQK